ncbi:MAG: flagellin, partial [Methanospirillum sp.]|nr:flagellin [Methanospirillum sp.]
MASEAISSSIMIIGAVLGAAVLITAILPAIFSAGDTFGTVSSSAEQKLKTDFRIVNTYTAGGTTVQVWMKNVGNTRISVYDIKDSDVFLGIGSSYERYGY